MSVLRYVDEHGGPFDAWFDGLEARAAAKVNTALTRIEAGNFSNVKGVGAGVFEYTLDYGPGYRIYFGKDGPEIVILLGGGTKKRQEQDICRAQNRWLLYKQSKKQQSKKEP